MSFKGGYSSSRLSGVLKGGLNGFLILLGDDNDVMARSIGSVTRVDCISACFSLPWCRCSL